MSEFPDKVRAAIYEAGGGRCVGCGRPDVTAQHRRRRGMGGTRDPLSSTPANGVPLCGSGTAGCHGWTERHPVEAELLGWRLLDHADQLTAPFYTRFGWRVWVRLEGSAAGLVPDYYAVAYVDEDELDRREARAEALTTFNRRAAGWR